MEAEVARNQEVERAKAEKHIANMRAAAKARVAGAIAEGTAEDAPDPAVTPDVAPDISPAVTPLLLLVLFTVVASRGRIRVTVDISDFWARVSSSSEGCSTS